MISFSIWKISNLVDFLKKLLYNIYVRLKNKSYIIILVPWCSWLTHRTVTAKSVGSNPIGIVCPSKASKSLANSKKRKTKLKLYDRMLFERSKVLCQNGVEIPSNMKVDGRIRKHRQEDKLNSEKCGAGGHSGKTLLY